MVKAIPVPAPTLEEAAQFLLWQKDRGGPVMDSLEAWEALRAALNTRAAHRIEATASTATVDGLADEQQIETILLDFARKGTRAEDRSAAVKFCADNGDFIARAILAALRQPAIEAAPEGEVEDLIARLKDGTRAIGTHEDNSTELFDVQDADEAMWKAASALTSLQAENARLSALVEEAEELRFWLRKAGAVLAPHSADAPGTPTRDALVFVNAGLNSQARPIVRAALSDAPNPVEQDQG